jgi:hypothetical protein
MKTPKLPGGFTVGLLAGEVLWQVAHLSTWVLVPVLLLSLVVASVNSLAPYLPEIIKELSHAKVRRAALNKDECLDVDEAVALITGQYAPSSQPDAVETLSAPPTVISSPDKKGVLRRNASRARPTLPPASGDADAGGAALAPGSLPHQFAR